MRPHTKKCKSKILRKSPFLMEIKIDSGSPFFAPGPYIPVYFPPNTLYDLICQSDSGLERLVGYVSRC